MVKTGTESPPPPPPPSPEHIAGNSQQKYTGVRKRKWGKWVSEIRLPNSRERIWLGSYDSPEKAARAFDTAMYCLRGPNARFNFPNNPPDIVGGESLSPHSIQAVAARIANENNPTPATAEISGQSCSPAATSEAVEMESGIDWSFLDMLDSNNEVGREFGYYSGLDNMGDGYYPPAPPPPSVYDDDQNVDDSSYSQQSFLWNFN